MVISAGRSRRRQGGVVSALVGAGDCSGVVVGERQANHHNRNNLKGDGGLVAAMVETLFSCAFCHRDRHYPLHHCDRRLQGRHDAATHNVQNTVSAIEKPLMAIFEGRRKSSSFLSLC